MKDERGGGTEARAAEIVCAVKELPSPAISTILAQLVDKSRVEVLLTETPRYRLLEPIREYCLERLNADGNYEETVRRHGAWLADCGDAVHESMKTGDTGLLVASTAEFDNVRAALGRLIGLKNHDDSVTAARIAGGLRFLWFLSGSMPRRNNGATILRDISISTVRLRIMDVFFGSRFRRRAAQPRPPHAKTQRDF